ncbi:hemagglutinin repeat-containing protein, partial [Leeia aquatica]
GRVLTGHNLTLNSTGQVRLQQGLTSGGNLQVNAGQLQVDGNVQSGGDLRLQSAQNLQIAGSLRSGGNLRLDSTGLTNLQQGLTSNSQLQLQAGQLQLGGNLYAAGDAALQVHGDLSNSVRLASGGNLQLQAANLNNTGMLAAGLRSDGTLGAQGQLILQVSNQVTQTGSLVAASDLNLAATQLNNQGVTYAAQDLHVEAGKLSNTAVLLSGRDTRLVVGELYNQSGGEVQAGRHLKVTGSNNARASVVLNDRARMEAQQGDVEIRATQFQNLGADPAAYRVSSPVSDQIQIAQHPNYANAISRAQGFYDYWLSYVPELVQYQHWLPYTGTDKRVQLKVDGYIEQLNPGFVAQPARLLAGHDLTLDVGTGSNRYSNIIAGNNIQLTGGSFTNTGLALTSDVTIQPIYEDGTAASNHWPGSHIYLAPLHHVKTQGSVSSIIGAGNTLTVSGLASFVNDNGLSQSAYVVTGSGNSSTPPTSLGGGVTLNNSGQLNVSGVSGNGLFILASSDNPRYLIEGNPLFTDKNRFLSSDYFLSSLGIDPQRMQKRLGDGAYEQQLVRNQLMQRTGKQYAFNTDANTDYRTLLDNAARFARSLQISPGIALTSTQLGRLTEDMVWMEERVVNGQRVLVPQLYLAGNVPTRLAPNGAVVMAKNLNLSVQQLQNSGAMVADSGLLVSANDLINRNGTLQAGGPLQLLARNDLQSQGGVLQGGQVQLAANRDVLLNGTQVQSEGALRIEAGRNLSLGTVTEQYTAGGQQGQGHDETWSSSGTRQHVSQLASRGDLTLLTGQDLTLQGTQLSTTGNALIAAGGDVTITAATETFQNHTEQHKKGFRRKTDEIRDTATETVIGSNIQVMGQLDIQSGKNLTISGSRVSAQQDLNVLAQQDVNITEQTERSSNHYEYHDKRSGFTIGFTGPTYSKSRTNLLQNGTSERAVSSELSGSNINVQSGRDTTVRGSMLLADKDLTVQAGRNILIDAAHEQRTNDRHFDSKSSSIGITGFSKSMATQDGNGNGHTAVTSLLSANRGNLSLIAGGSGEVKGKGSVTTVGADLLAGQGILIDASNIDLLAAYNSDSSHSRSASKSVSVGASLTGYIGGPLNQILNNLEAARKGSGNSRLDTALALKAGYDSYKLATDKEKWDRYKAERDAPAKDSNTQGSDNTQGGQGGQGTNGQGGQKTNNEPGIGISVGFSNSKSSSSSDSSSSSAKGSNLQAQSIVLLARDTDIRTEGAKLQAKDIDLDAARNIELAAAVNQANVHSQNSSKGSSFGVTFGFGQQNGFSFQIGGSKGKGLTDGSET